MNNLFAEGSNDIYEKCLNFELTLTVIILCIDCCYSYFLNFWWLNSHDSNKPTSISKLSINYAYSDKQCILQHSKWATIVWSVFDSTNSHVSVYKHLMLNTCRSTDRWVTWLIWIAAIRFDILMISPEIRPQIPFKCCSSLHCADIQEHFKNGTNTPHHFNGNNYKEHQLFIQPCL